MSASAAWIEDRETKTLAKGAAWSGLGSAIAYDLGAVAVALLLGAFAALCAVILVIDVRRHLSGPPVR